MSIIIDPINYLYFALNEFPKILAIKYRNIIKYYIFNQDLDLMYLIYIINLMLDK